MKTYEEMAKYVLEVRDETEKKRKHRKAAAKRVIPAAAGVIGALIIGLSVWKGYTRPDTISVPDNIIEVEITSVQGTTMPITTTKSATSTTTAATVSEKSGSKTTVSVNTVTSSKTAVTAATDTTQRASAHITTAETVERTTASSALETTVTSATTTAVTLTAQGSTTTTKMVGGNGGLSGDGNNGGMPGGTGGGMSGGGMSGGAGGGMSGGAGGGMSGGAYEGQGTQLPINQQYCYAFIEGKNYIYTNLYMISSGYVGAWIDSAEMLAAQLINGQESKCTADVYLINGFSDDEAVAIKFSGHDEYYLYYSVNTDVYKIMSNILSAE